MILRASVISHLKRVSMDNGLRKTLSRVCQFYDQRKVGEVGALGFWRSTDLKKLLGCVLCLVKAGLIHPGKSLFLDMGCADGRVNVLLSYLVGKSVGIERDKFFLEEYAHLRTILDRTLEKEGLIPSYNNIYLFHGDSTDEAVHGRLRREVGVGLEDFDLFYTYLVMHREFAEVLSEKAKKGAIFMVYGLEKILPQYEGLRLLSHLSPLKGIMGVYKKA